MRQDFKPNERIAIGVDDNGVAQVRLTRADKMNALDPEMFAALLAAAHHLHDLPGLRCVVLSGQGRSFCAGLDLGSMANTARHDRTPLTERSHGNANQPQQVAMQWRKLAVPVIAAVHGVCFGGGLQIASGADVRVVQALLGPVDVSTRMIYGHAMRAAGVPSPQGYLVALLPKPAPFDGRR